MKNQFVTRAAIVALATASLVAAFGITSLADSAAVSLGAGHSMSESFPGRGEDGWSVGQLAIDAINPGGVMFRCARAGASNAYALVGQ